jgi:cell wall-associated NlpC family hydrolase
VTRRELALRYAWSWLGRPYVWGGDDPSGIDCSGLVIEILAGVGILPHGYDNTAGGLFERFKSRKIDAPKPGALVFYEQAAGAISHVGLVLEHDVVLQAAGGGSSTTSPDAAWAAGAFVKLRPLAYRFGIRLYVDPFDD